MTLIRTAVAMLTLALLAVPGIAVAGGVVFSPAQTITASADGATSVFAGDVDGDGDLDVLSSSTIDDTIAWYENTDGGGSFGPAHTITTGADYAQSVFAADVDGDGDLDVLSASNTIAWYANTDGAGSFGPAQVIGTTADSVLAADVDGDGPAQKGVP